MILRLMGMLDYNLGTLGLGIAKLRSGRVRHVSPCLRNLTKLRILQCMLLEA